MGEKQRERVRKAFYVLAGQYLWTKPTSSSRPLVQRSGQAKGFALYALKKWLLTRGAYRVHSVRTASVGHISLEIIKMYLNLC